MAKIVVSVEPVSGEAVVNGAAVAAFLGAGIGTFLLGLVVLLNETGVVSLPALYAPAGGLSTRMAVAVVFWLVAWGVLHSRWKHRAIAPGPIYTVTLLLIALGILGTFPPFLGLF